jgi:Protein of unknown function (DUF2971)
MRHVPSRAANGELALEEPCPPRGPGPPRPLQMPGSLMEHEIVYQYTSHQAAMAILLNEELWLTNLQFLNDGGEFWWMYEQFEAYIRDRATANDPIPESIVKSTLLLTERRDRGISICVACFSRQSDDSAQWYRYADEGRGVTVGFHVEELFNSLRSEHGQASKVTYGPAQCRDGLERAVRALEESERRGEPIIGTIHDPLSSLATFSKESTFASEQEFRIALFGCAYTRYKFRHRVDSLIPYVALPIRRDCIAEIKCGPKSALESVVAWEILLAQVYGGGPHNDIRLSRSLSRLR